MGLILRPSSMFTLLALAGGAFSVARSGAGFAGPITVAVVVALAVVAGLGVERLTNAIGLALARRAGGGSFDSAPSLSRWWWVASTVAGALAAGDALAGVIDWTLPIAVVVVWLGVGLAGTWVLLRRRRGPMQRADQSA